MTGVVVLALSAAEAARLLDLLEIREGVAVDPVLVEIRERLAALVDMAVAPSKSAPFLALQEELNRMLGVPEPDPALQRTTTRPDLNFPRTTDVARLLGHSGSPSTCPVCVAAGWPQPSDARADGVAQVTMWAERGICERCGRETVVVRGDGRNACAPCREGATG